MVNSITSPDPDILIDMDKQCYPSYICSGVQYTAADFFIRGGGGILGWVG